ncbi:type II secretion system protein [Kineococcus sp. NPDC059986]|uniref:type IV pilin protein n=1 Tax=Kineococcus sp. NPDC059986 TaxID=3155538 RepID=UPI0034502289
MLARIRKSIEEKDQGFTLIELLVVMIIIGILAAIAIPVFLNQRKKAVDSSLKSDLRTVAQAEETYFTDSQTYTAGAQTAAGQDFTGAGDPVKVSKDNAITVTLNPAATGLAAGSAYCIKGTNAKASGDWYYISNKGGLQPSGTSACSF